MSTSEEAARIGVPAPGKPTPDLVAVTVSGRAWLMLALATVGFAVNFWAWALLSPLGPLLKDSLHLIVVLPGPDRCRTGDRRLAGADPGRRADRPVRRPGDVPGGVAGDDRAGAVPGPGRPFQPGRCPGRWLLPGHRRYRVRGRRSVRQRLVPAAAPWVGGRDLRCRDGWNRDQRADAR